MILDSDVLFHQYPSELINAIEQQPWVDRYNRDVETWYSYAWTTQQIRASLGVEIPAQFNAGLMTTQVDGEHRTEFFEECLRALPWPEGNAHYVDQTLQALYAAKQGARPLPDNYDVCARLLRLGEANLVSQHYCGPMRTRLYEDFIELMPGLYKSLSD
jgi:hypothetical protein